MTPEEVVARLFERLKPEAIEFMENEVSDMQSRLRRAFWRRLWSRLSRWLLLLLIVLAILLWIRACNELNTTLVTPTQVGALCAGTGVEMQQQTIVETSYWGCRTSYNNAMATAAAQCARMSSACIGTCPGAGTCAPGLSTVNVSQIPAALWCDTVLTFVCPCMGC